MKCYMGHFGQTPPTAQTIVSNANVRNLENQIEETTKSISKIESDIIAIVKSYRAFWNEIALRLMYLKKTKVDPKGYQKILDYIKSKEIFIVELPIISPFRYNDMAKSRTLASQYASKTEEKTALVAKLAELKDKLLIEKERAEKEKIRIENELAKANAPKMNKGLIAGVAALGVAAYLYSQD